MLAPLPGYTTQEAVDAATALITLHVPPSLLIDDLEILWYELGDVEVKYAEAGRALYEAAQEAGTIEDEDEDAKEEALMTYAHEAHQIACRPVYAAIAAQLRAEVGGLPENLTFVRNKGEGSGSKFWHTDFYNHRVYIGNLDDNEINGYTDFVARLLTRGANGQAAHQSIGSLQVLARIQDANNPNQSRLIAQQRGENLLVMKIDDILKSGGNSHKDAREALQKYFLERMGIGSLVQGRLRQRYGDFEVLFGSKDDFYFIDFGGFVATSKVLGSKAKRIKTPAGGGRHQR